MSAEIAEGDVVRLAGSSTKMVVHRIAAGEEAEALAIEGLYFCRWFNDADDLQEANFHAHELRLVEARA